MACLQYIAFDFETSGLPKGRKPCTRETLEQYDTCRAVSLSAARFSSRGRLINTFDAIIYPDDFEIGAGSVAVHGITQDYAKKVGTPFLEVFMNFMKFVGPRTTTLVAHNAQFDVSVFKSEMLRCGLDPVATGFDKFNIVCTLELYKNRFMRPIKLTNLYEEIYGEKFENAHNSLADCIACGRVYPHLMGQPTQDFKNIGIPKIILGASSVASAIGVSHFKKQPELISELWKKYSPKTFNGSTEDDKALEILGSLPATKEILQSAENFKSEESSDVQKQTRKLFYDIERSQLKPQDVVKAKEYIRKVLFTNHGTRNEYKTADTDVMADKLYEDDTYYTYNICEIEGTLYQVVGRVDRIQKNDDGSRFLVEIKNRARGLFNHVKDYEEVQCQTYLHMLKDIEYCRLVETYNGVSKSYLIQKNKDKWDNEIVPKLQNFCEHFHSMLSIKNK